jgi:hypothetical protein
MGADLALKTRPYRSRSHGTACPLSHETPLGQVWHTVACSTLHAMTRVPVRAHRLQIT